MRTKVGDLLVHAESGRVYYHKKYVYVQVTVDRRERAVVLKTFNTGIRALPIRELVILKAVLLSGAYTAYAPPILPKPTRGPNA